MNKIKILILSTFLVSSALNMSKVVGADALRSIELPPIPTRVITLTDHDILELTPEEIKKIYPESLCEQVNQAHFLLYIKQDPTSEDIENGVDLYVKTAKLGEPYSLEQLAYYALDGRHGVPKDIDWARDVLFFLTEKDVTGAQNELALMNPKITLLIRDKKTEEARRLFDQCIKGEKQEDSKDET